MKVDLNKYLGKWYEVARLDNNFQPNMNNVEAEYSLNDDGFSAKILMDKVTENSDAHKLQSIDFLEYFASVGAEEEGFYLMCRANLKVA